ncbi:WhiB family transcriptional regulator [Kitasatospora sp. NPDC002040]|uniref:WhiB family transcriptional regulator n=1 Tax=Kitasatospora sp. NPDC002040 TaxID=3154661 RepID=UPI00333324C4
MTVFNFSARPMSSAYSTTDVQTETVGSCAGIDSELSFPLAQSRTALETTPGEQAALDICATCPLAQRTACLTAELSFGPTHQWGVFGGMTAAQRRYVLNRTRTTDRLTAQIARQLNTPTAAVVLPLAG